MVAGPSCSPFKDREKNLLIEFERNSDGRWKVHDHDENIGKPCVWTGLVPKTSEVEVYSEYMGGDRGNMDEGTPGGPTTGCPPQPPFGFEIALLQTDGVSGGKAGERWEEAHGSAKTFSIFELD